jgi:hypothetical protein
MQIKAPLITKEIIKYNNFKTQAKSLTCSHSTIQKNQNFNEVVLIEIYDHIDAYHGALNDDTIN